MNFLQTTPIKAIVFDVFGTLAQIGDKRAPYAQLMRLGRAMGRMQGPGDAARIMSSSLDLAAAARLFGLELEVDTLAALESDLLAELATISLFSDTIPALNALRGAGYQIGLCSTLAAPYAAPVRDLVPWSPDACAWSFEAGAIKPDPAIYAAVCAALGCAAHEVLMVGDTLEADVAGPRRFGMAALHLARKGSSPAADWITSLNELPGLLARS